MYSKNKFWPTTEACTHFRSLQTITEVIFYYFQSLFWKSLNIRYSWVCNHHIPLNLMQISIPYMVIFKINFF